MERSEIRDRCFGHSPDFASRHPGYENHLRNPTSRPISAAAAGFRAPFNSRCTRRVFAVMIAWLKDTERRAYSDDGPAREARGAGFRRSSRAAGPDGYRIWSSLTFQNPARTSAGYLEDACTGIGNRDGLLPPLIAAAYKACRNRASVISLQISYILDAVAYPFALYLALAESFV